MSEVTILANGTLFKYWSDVKISQAIDRLCYSFNIESGAGFFKTGSDWRIKPLDLVEINFGNVKILRGLLDKARLGFTDQESRISIEGRDISSLLVDSSVVEKFSYNAQPARSIADSLVSKFNGISIGDGLSGSVNQFNISPGKSVYDALLLLSRKANLHISTNGFGRIDFFRDITEVSESLIEGQNILKASADFDVSDRFSEYILKAQAASSSSEWLSPKESAQIKDRVVDTQIADQIYKPRLIHYESITSQTEAKRHLQWEMAIRKARSFTAQITVRGWLQNSGKPWTVWAKTYVRSPRLGIDGEMLVKAVSNTFNLKDGFLTELDLTGVDAYRPEPVVKDPTKKSGNADWLKAGAG